MPPPPLLYASFHFLKETGDSEINDINLFKTLRIPKSHGFTWFYNTIYNNILTIYNILKKIFLQRANILFVFKDSDGTDDRMFKEESYFRSRKVIKIYLAERILKRITRDAKLLGHSRGNHVSETFTFPSDLCSELPLRGRPVSSDL